MKSTKAYKVYQKERWKASLSYVSGVIGLVLLFAGSSMAAVQTDGPLVGGVTDSSAKIFVRTDSLASVVIEFSEDASLVAPTVTTPRLTKPEDDFTAILVLKDLQPETTYYYRVLVDGIPQQRAPFPSFTTFPPPGSAREFAFAVVSDLHNIHSPRGKPFELISAPVYAQVVVESPAFVLQIGDFDHRNVRTLQEMRLMHREVRGPYNAAGFDFFRYIAPKFPFFHVWDDHDYGPNNGDKTFPGRADALKAFQEYYPTPELENPTAGIWHKFTYGQVEVFMLDLRSQRDPNFDPDGPEKSMLDGDRIPNGQKTWLKTGLLTSKARWKFLISSVAFNPTAKLQPKDSWGGFATERAEILDFIRQNDIQGVIVISGDLHTGGGIDDGTFSGLPEITVPHTNLFGDTVSASPGFWSEGVVVPSHGKAGYALITILTDPDRVVLEARGVNGKLHKRLVTPVLILNPTSRIIAESANYDGIGPSDLAVWRPSDGSWHISLSSGGSVTQSWGTSGDVPVPGDYDGDGKTDLAVWRPSDGSWHISLSSGGSVTQSWGTSGDVPVPGDYDGDGKTDLAVWRPSDGSWHISLSSGGSVTQSWGTSGDVPVPGDYDGDGKTDLAVWRPDEGNWYTLFSTGDFAIQSWGISGDKPVPADYDGDGRTDIAVWRPREGKWFILPSSEGTTTSTWGILGDVPVPADYDGDGRVDIATWRPTEGKWYILLSTGGFKVQLLGTSGDLPVSSSVN